MSLYKSKLLKFVALLCLLIVAGSGGVALAAQSQSSHYQVNEVYFGSGGALNLCSSNYCAKESAGALGVGRTASPSYQAHAGFNTDRQPFIQFIVSSSNIDIGTLTPGTTKTATATFSVKTYLASGYSVTTQATPPANNGYVMQALATPTASSAGQEQFGINLVANTSPTAFGSGPVQVPSSSFGFGQVASGYDQTNKYKYADGDVIAYSSKSSGETDYTISYIFNVSNVTPGGTYVMNDVLVATSTF